MTGAHRQSTSVRQHRSVLDVLRHAPRPVWVLIAGVFVNRVGSFFSIFVVLFLTTEGFTPADLPPVLVGVAATSMVGSLAGGWVADLLGRKASLVIAMAGSGVSLLLLSAAAGRTQTVLAVCVVAFFSQSYVPAASALLVDHSAPKDRVPVFALFRLALNLGAAIGPLLAGLLATLSYTALFLVDSITCLLFALVLVVGLPKTARSTRPEGRDPDQRAPVRPVTSGRSHRWPVLALCLALCCVAMVYAQYSSTLPLSLTADGRSPRFYGFLLAFNAVLVIALELPLSGLTRRVSPRLPLASGAALIGLGMALSGLVDGPALVLAAVALWSLGEILLAPVANAAVADLSPPEQIGRYQGLLSTAQALGFALGPAVGTYAYSAGETLPWVGALAVGLLAVVVIVSVSPSAAATRSHRTYRHARTADPASSGPPGAAGRALGLVVRPSSR